MLSIVFVFEDVIIKGHFNADILSVSIKFIKVYEYLPNGNKG